MTTLRSLMLLFAVACAGAQKPVTPPTPPTTTTPPVVVGASCDAHQAQVLRDADARATPWTTEQHLAKNFPDGKVSWLMKDASYQSYVVKPGAKQWGRCDATGCYVFTAPAAVIHAAVEHSMAGGHHDPAAIGKALGLPATNFEGPLRMMTLDTHQVPVCARLPVDADPGVWACKPPPGHRLLQVRRLHLGQRARAHGDRRPGRPDRDRRGPVARPHAPCGLTLRNHTVPGS